MSKRLPIRSVRDFGVRWASPCVVLLCLTTVLGCRRWEETEVPTAPPAANPDDVESWLSAILERADTAFYHGNTAEALKIVHTQAIDANHPRALEARQRLHARAVEFKIFAAIFDQRALVSPELLAQLRGEAEGLAGQEGSWLHADIYHALAKARFYAEDFVGAQDAYIRAAESYAAVGARSLAADARAFVLLCRQRQLYELEDQLGLADLIPAYEAEIERNRAEGTRLALAYNLRHLGFLVAWDVGSARDLSRGEALFRESLAIRDEIGFMPYLAPAHTTLADLLVEQGREHEALPLYQRAFETADRLGFVRYQVHPRLHAANLLVRRGAVDEAKNLRVQALAIAQQADYGPGEEQARAALDSHGSL